MSGHSMRVSYKKASRPLYLLNSCFLCLLKFSSIVAFLKKVHCLLNLIVLYLISSVSYKMALFLIIHFMNSKIIIILGAYGIKTERNKSLARSHLQV